MEQNGKPRDRPPQIQSTVLTQKSKDIPMEQIWSLQQIILEQ